LIILTTSSDPVELPADHEQIGVDLYIEEHDTVVCHFDDGLSGESVFLRAFRLSSEAHFISVTTFKEIAAWLGELLAKTMILFFKSDTSYFMPDSCASSRIFLMKSIDGLVPG
jgi:hypothetical protein